MKFFWPIFGLTAVISTACVYVAAPLARPCMAAFFGKKAPLPASLDAPAVAAQHAAPVLRRFTPETESQEAPQAAANALPEGAAAVLQQDDADDTPPAMHGIFLASRGERPSWGITNQRATTYQLDGTRQGHVSGGVVLEYKDARNSSIGNMVECRLIENGVTSAPPCLVSRKDIYLFTGPYAALSPRQRKNLQAYYELSGKIAMRKTELLQASAAKNPFFSQYSASYKAFMAHIEAGKALTAQRDSATELDKSRLEDQLREMKIAETRLRAEYESVHLKFRTWKDQHANEIAKAENDVEVVKWSKEMQALRSGIAGLAY